MQADGETLYLDSRQ